MPPQGSAVEVPLHASTGCILSLPEEPASQALASSPDFAMRSWGDDSIAVRAVNSQAAPAPVMLATITGWYFAAVNLTG